MKTLVVIALLGFAQLGLACVVQEAQFIGTVQNYEKVAVDQYDVDCSYQIEFSLFESSLVCPLVVGEVAGYRFQDRNCSLKNGDKVSGIFAKKDSVIEIQ